MQEPEVSLRIAMNYIRGSKTCANINVSIDGAHVKTKETVHFDIEGFLNNNGFAKCDGTNNRWQGEYACPNSPYRIVVSSTPGIGDVTIVLSDGTKLFIESKKFKSGSGGEYPAMREAIGQLMTGCPDHSDIIPVVAVPYSTKSAELAQKWTSSKRMRMAGIRFMLVRDDGSINFI